MNIKKLEAVVEAILFTMGEAVEIERLAAAVEHDEDTVRKIIRSMMTRYEEEDRGIHLIELDGSFQLCTKPEMYEYLIKVATVTAGGKVKAKGTGSCTIYVIAKNGCKRKVKIKVKK